MKSIKFWRMEAKRLSLTEKMFFRDAIKTLLAWTTLKEEYIELDLIMRILESEIRVIIPESTHRPVNTPYSELQANAYKSAGQSLLQYGMPFLRFIIIYCYGYRFFCTDQYYQFLPPCYARIKKVSL